MCRRPGQLRLTGRCPRKASPTVRYRPSSPRRTEPKCPSRPLGRYRPGDGGNGRVGNPYAGAQEPLEVGVRANRPRRRSRSHPLRRRARDGSVCQRSVDTGAFLHRCHLPGRPLRSGNRQFRGMSGPLPHGFVVNSSAASYSAERCRCPWTPNSARNASRFTFQSGSSSPVTSVPAWPELDASGGKGPGAQGAQDHDGLMLVMPNTLRSRRSPSCS